MSEVGMMNFSLENLDKAMMVPSCSNCESYTSLSCAKITIKTTKSLVHKAFNVISCQIGIHIYTIPSYIRIYVARKQETRKF